MLIVVQVMSFPEWLSIIARSELGSDLDCNVINSRSELGSDLDCYELIQSTHTVRYQTLRASCRYILIGKVAKESSWRC